MPVLMIAEVPGMTEEIYGGMVSQLKPVLQSADGFISHAGLYALVGRRRDVNPVMWVLSAVSVGLLIL